MNKFKWYYILGLLLVIYLIFLFALYTYNNVFKKPYDAIDSEVIEFRNRSVIKIPLPDFSQEKDYSCGSSALRSILCYYSEKLLEEEFISKDLNLTEAGLDPYQIITLLEKYKTKHNLHYEEFRNMTIEKLTECIDNNKPVMMMVQAWSAETGYDYENDFNNGHWIIAIGYDEDNFYFEDPSLGGARGYINKGELLRRWHDIEFSNPDHKEISNTFNYGISIWGDNIYNNIIRVKKIN
jgi:uncharacterized protein